ncbi:hypothetical protein A2U01_0053624 [Trifolium medium]|uniref:Uncharacterized protein n=1 Tax=Trifolium medium TaxID=97028 RepID=A0A392R744_9FABA|nr:hypothetical protein [Trifolium medium]
MEKVLLAARGAWVGGARRQTVKHCMWILCYRCAAQLHPIWRVAPS